MIISFDLDDTLIPTNNRFELEPQSLLQKLLGTERLRAGTIRLIKQLQSQGNQISIYTTSYRSISKIRSQFFLYGIRLHKVINQHIHEKKLGENAKLYSKYPPAFGIDLHIDDSKGVEIEGKIHGFNTIIVSHTDDWADIILNSINKR